MKPKLKGPILIIPVIFIAFICISGCMQESETPLKDNDKNQPNERTRTPVEPRPDKPMPEESPPIEPAPSVPSPKEGTPPEPTHIPNTDPNLVVSVYDEEKAYKGTTLFTDTHDPSKIRALEIDMEGEIVWEFEIPQEWLKGSLVGFDAELLENGNILFIISNSGVYEIDRDGNTVWSYSDAKVSHDADRLSNGNTLVVFGNMDGKDDIQIKEVDSGGNIVWQWKAKDNYGDSTQFGDIKMQGWTHANAVQRLSDGTTMVSLRNFYLTTIIDKDGTIAKEYDWSGFGTDTDPHEPEIHEDVNRLVVCLQNDAPHAAVEINMETEEILWTYSNKNLRTSRDCDKLPNGNVLIVTVDNGGTGGDNKGDDESTIIEVTPSGEIVWRLELKNNPVGENPGWFFKAQRIG